MVRTVVGDETHLNSIETKLSQSPISVQVGLAIGKLGGANSNRDSVFALIPTPPNDGLDPASLISAESSKSGRADKKKVTKGKSAVDSSSLTIDVEWVAEHARQVSKMLVGGLHVVGIYVWAAESAFKNSTLVLWQAVKAIARATPVNVNGEADERILVHISYSPRRLPLLQEDIQKTNNMKKVLLKAIGLLDEQLKSAKALLDGTLVTEDKLSIPGGPHEIELLLPFADVKSLQAGSSEEVAGLVVFSGTIFAQAYTFPREPLLQAVEDLKVSHPWMCERKFTKVGILQDGFAILCVIKVLQLVSTWSGHKVCDDSNIMGLVEISSFDGIWSTLDQLCMVVDFALSRLPLSKEHHHELRQSCAGYILLIEKVISTTRRSQGEVHMNIGVAQHKRGGVTLNLDTCANDHQQDMREAIDDSILLSNVRGNTLMTTTSMIFNLDVVVIAIISLHIILVCTHTSGYAILQLLCQCHVASVDNFRS
ncbi:hypothetical protein KI387_012257 [Taxus chinensis]|uniref:Uncharacterized protein n=1 Tax=Taxus chinensis TaxID=29808 RepID=A0AA38CQ97_TAXCH|nr:hypothetical protein KI387_012257 [Taxus chinensis]